MKAARGWAARVVGKSTGKPTSKSTSPYPLIAMADDLLAAIRDANFPLRGPTLHMQQAAAVYEEWRAANAR